MVRKRIASGLLLVLIAGSMPGIAVANDWEYRVVILKGLTAGGKIQKHSNAIYIDTRRTEALNELAVEGWELVSVVGSTGTDHTVYLRRRRN